MQLLQFWRETCERIRSEGQRSSAYEHWLGERLTGAEGYGEAVRDIRGGGELLSGLIGTR
jgi:hypothetical protein